MSKKLLSIFIVLSILVVTSGCGGNNTNKAGETEQYKEISTLIDSIDVSILTDAASMIEGDMPLSDVNTYASKLDEAFQKADAKEKSRLALEMADDMAYSSLFGLITPEMMRMAGDAVKAYPHPLLLNNYGTMLLDTNHIEEALTFYQLAANQESGNPVIQTNLASVFLEVDDFSSAELYAKKALAAASDFGPAYQVLTTIHLKNNDFVLAAETMVKSAKHCFNDVTIHHFDTFLEAVSQLDPEEDEYPLKEEYLKELYLIAKENTGILDESHNVDTPENQLTLRPFPQIGGTDNLKKSTEYLNEQISKIYAAKDEAENRRLETLDLIGEKEQSQSTEGSQTYSVSKSLRQIYSIKVLTSYYQFKLNQLALRYGKDSQDIQQQQSDELNKKTLEYEQQYEAIDQQEVDQQSEFWESMITAFDGGAAPDVKKLLETGLLQPRLQVMEQKAVMQIHKKYKERIIALTQNYYKDMKQLLEEYWLKTGGLLKYVQDERAFYDLSISREILVYTYIVAPLNTLVEMSESLKDDDERLRLLEMQLNMMEQAVTGANQAMEQAEFREENGGENESSGENLVPDIEKGVLSVYPEANDDSIGGEVDIFGIIGANIQYDGSKVDLGLDSIAGSISGYLNPDNGDSGAQALYGVNAMGSTEWFKDTKTVTNALQKAGVIGEAAGALGKIGFGYSDSNRKGIFMEKDGQKNEISDIGTLHVRETGGNVSAFGKSEIITIKRSQMTGVATKTKHIKYKFLYFTYTNRVKY